MEEQKVTRLIELMGIADRLRNTEVRIFGQGNGVSISVDFINLETPKDSAAFCESVKTCMQEAIAPLIEKELRKLDARIQEEKGDGYVELFLHERVVALADALNAARQEAARQERRRIEASLRARECVAKVYHRSFWERLKYLFTGKTEHIEVD